MNAVVYNGKVHDHLAKLAAVAENIESLERVVVFRNVDQDFDLSKVNKG